MIQNDNIAIYPTPKKTILSLLAGLTVTAGLITLIVNVGEETTINFFTYSEIVVPKILLTLYKVVSSIFAAVLCLLIWGRLNDLFHMTPIMFIKKDSLDIRRLLYVEKVDWANIKSITFVRHNSNELMHLRYSRKDAKISSKHFKCYVSDLNITKTRLEEILLSKIQNM